MQDKIQILLESRDVASLNMFQNTVHYVQISYLICRLILCCLYQFSLIITHLNKFIHYHICEVLCTKSVVVTGVVVYLGWCLLIEIQAAAFN